MNYFALMVDVWTAFCVVLPVAAVVLWIMAFDVNNALRKNLINEVENFLEKLKRENKALKEETVLVIESLKKNLQRETENLLSNLEKELLESLILKKNYQNQIQLLSDKNDEIERLRRLVENLKTDKDKLKEKYSVLQNEKVKVNTKQNEKAKINTFSGNI